MDRSEVWRAGLLPSRDFLDSFVATYNAYTREAPGFEVEHPEDIAASAMPALEWYAHGWNAALDYIKGKL